VSDRRGRRGERGSSKQGRWGADAWDLATVPIGTGQTMFNDLNLFKRFQNHSNFERSRNDLLELEKFKIKYGFEGFDEKNNFTY
jgi:hypothetical protein